MSFGYRYTLLWDHDGKWLVRFPGIPEATAEAATPEQARARATDCLISALTDIMRADRPLPRDGNGPVTADRAKLPSLVTAKLAVYEHMHEKGWTRARLAAELGTHENAIRRLLDLRHNSHMWVIDEALAKMNTYLQIELPRLQARRHAA
jgi:antitoxin HicB